MSAIWEILKWLYKRFLALIIIIDGVFVFTRVGRAAANRIIIASSTRIPDIRIAAKVLLSFVVVAVARKYWVLNWESNGIILVTCKWIEQPPVYVESLKYNWSKTINARRRRFTQFFLMWCVLSFLRQTMYKNCSHFIWTFSASCKTVSTAWIDWPDFVCEGECYA